LTGREAGGPAWPSEPGAERLYRAVRAACGGGGEFAERVDAGLSAALSALAADPDLCRDLVVLGSDPRTLSAQRGWVDRFGELLRGAAADQPGVNLGPRFREPFLVDCVRLEVGRRVLAGEAARLQALRPELLELIMAYYRELAPERGEPSRSVLTGAQCGARSQ
jgi:hypothetical protein